MSLSSLIINYGSPSALINDAFIQLEQDPIDENINYLTTQQAATALEHFINNKTLPSTYCTPDIVEKYVYAYPWPGSLINYQCFTTKGILGRGALQNVDIVEELNCDLNNILNTNYPVHQIKSYTWKTEAYNDLGEEVSKPVLSLDGPKIKLSAKVYGTVEVVYTTKQEVLTIYIIYNNDVIEGETLDPYLLCVWAGGNTALKIKFADGEEDVKCNNRYDGSGNLYINSDGSGDSSSGGGSNTTIIDAPYDPGYVEGKDVTYKIDYCTRKKLTP